MTERKMMIAVVKAAMAAAVIVGALAGANLADIGPSLPTASADPVSCAGGPCGPSWRLSPGTITDWHVGGGNGVIVVNPQGWRVFAPAPPPGVHRQAIFAPDGRFAYWQFLY